MRLTLIAILFTCCAVVIAASGLQRLGVVESTSVYEQEKNIVEYLNPAPSSRPLSEAVRAGEWLILSGKLGTDSSGKLAAGGIKPETKQTMDNIRGALERYGSSLDDVVKCTVMLADIKEFADMNEVYSTYFKKDRMPARSTFGVSGLALNARVEIECWAATKKR